METTNKEIGDTFEEVDGVTYEVIDKLEQDGHIVIVSVSRSKGED